MKSIITIFIKELKIQMRYRMIWINLSLTPFFMIAPYVFTAKGIDMNFESMVLIGSILWYWLNQFFFSIGDCFNEERETGTFVSIALSPISLIQYLIGKGLFEFFKCLCITVITMLIFTMVGIDKANNIKMLLVYLTNGIYMFTFSIFFSSMTLYFKKISSVNFLIQQLIGVLSGTTVNVDKYSRYVRVISNVIPLTFSIKIGRNLFYGKRFTQIFPDFLKLNVISIIYLILGLVLLKKVENNLRNKGEWEVW